MCHVTSATFGFSENKTCFLKKRAPRTFSPVLVSKILGILRNYSFILLASLALPQPYLHLICIPIPNLLIFTFIFIIIYPNFISTPIPISHTLLLISFCICIFISNFIVDSHFISMLCTSLYFQFIPFLWAKVDEG